MLAEWVKAVLVFRQMCSLFSATTVFPFRIKKKKKSSWTLDLDSFNIRAKIRPFFHGSWMEQKNSLWVSLHHFVCWKSYSITRSGQCCADLGKFPWASLHACCFSSHGLPTDHTGDFITSAPPERHSPVRGRKAGSSGENICHGGNVHIWAHCGCIFFCFSTRAWNGSSSWSSFD